MGNSVFTHSCDCKEGYYEDQGTCKDVDECADNPCSDSERCSNLEGLDARPAEMFLPIELILLTHTYC